VKVLSFTEKKTQSLKPYGDWVQGLWGNMEYGTSDIVRKQEEKKSERKVIKSGARFMPVGQSS